MKPKRIAGLGNPGPQYEHTRHNAGFWFVDRLVAQYGGCFRGSSRQDAEIAVIRVGSESVQVLNPLGFMNRSGGPIQQIAHYLRIPVTEVLVVHDDLDLPPGVARLKCGGGHGGHNGLRDVHRHLGADYLRLRIGIGHPGVREEVIHYVLGRPERMEEEQIMTSLTESLAVMDDVFAGRWDAAVRRLHSRPRDPEKLQENT
jgi:PTH1 family peptidyl-tRNA hydrolase